MAVLKRGDRIEGFRLDSARGFASSLSAAIGLLFSQFNEFCRRHWMLCVLCGILGVGWLAVYNSFSLFTLQVWRVLLHFGFGVLLIVVWSLMRWLQLPLVQKLGSDDSDSPTKKGFLVSLVGSLKSCVPLLLAWTVVFGAVYTLMEFVDNVYIVCAAAVLLTVFVFPLALLAQSYMEIVGDGRYGARLLEAFKLNLHYYGSGLAIWVLALFCVLLSFVLLFMGEGILMYLFYNKHEAHLMGEEIVVPSSVNVLSYVLTFVSMALFGAMQIVWSLAGQIHIHSVLCKQKRDKN